MPPHDVEDCTVFYFFLLCPRLLSLLSFVDVSRLLGLTLRPSALVFRCHLETFDTLEAGTCAGSHPWTSLVFPFVFLDGEVLHRILTAYEEFSTRRLLTQGVLFFFADPVFHCAINCANNVHSFRIVNQVFGIRLYSLKRDYCLVLARLSITPGGLTRSCTLQNLHTVTLRMLPGL